MFRFEHKLNEWINRYILHISIGFILIAAAWIRIAGINYVGNDFHYSLYDIPGNCHALPYRLLVQLLMRTDYAVVILKFISYIGDFGVAALCLLLLRQSDQQFASLRTFLLLCLFLLFPSFLLYSVAGMRIDSVCMCFILLSLYLFKKQYYFLSGCSIVIAPLLYPIYWPIICGMLIYMLDKAYRNNTFNKQMLSLIILSVIGLILSVFAELLLSSDNYFWGKWLIINPAAEKPYANFRLWLDSMFMMYGYCISFGSLYFAVNNKKQRIPALLLQIIIIMFVGWKMTAHFAL